MITALNVGLAGVVGLEACGFVSGGMSMVVGVSGELSMMIGGVHLMRFNANPPYQLIAHQSHHDKFTAHN